MTENPFIKHKYELKILSCAGTTTVKKVRKFVFKVTCSTANSVPLLWLLNLAIFGQEVTCPLESNNSLKFNFKLKMLQTSKQFIKKLLEKFQPKIRKAISHSTKHDNKALFCIYQQCINAWTSTAFDWNDAIFWVAYLCCNNQNSVKR